MYVKKLKLRNFRNYENAVIELSDGLNLITGDNAQGKTNLLESLVYLSLTRSHRISDDRKLIRDDCPFADIRCLCESGGREKELEAVISAKGKTLMVQRSPVTRSSEFIGLLNVILFAPDDLHIFSESPRERRRIMNQEITKISSRYLISLNRYQKLLKERNLLLKQPCPDRTYLETLSEQMSREEELIVRERKEFCDGINFFLDRIYGQLSNDPHTHIRAEYRSCFSEGDQQAIFHQHLSVIEKDLENRMTTTGIHREDLSFLMNDRNITETASQGQKRMTMLAFKLALHHHIRQKTGEDAVLLLDDVLSELDYEKQKRLLSLVSGSSQCLITATHIPDFLKSSVMKEFRISRGTIRQEDLNERNGKENSRRDSRY